MPLFLLVFLFSTSVIATPYELGSGGAIQITVSADVIQLGVDAIDIDDCDYETNEACQNIIREGEDEHR